MTRIRSRDPQGLPTVTSDNADEITTPQKMVKTEAMPELPATEVQPSEPGPAPSAESRSAGRSRFAADARAQHLERDLQSFAFKAKDKSSATDVGALPGARPKASSFTTVEQGVKALERDFGVTVKDRSSWSAEDLSRVHEAWSKMGAKENDALKGLDLRREGTPPDDVAHDHKGDGKVAGLYSAKTTPPSITFYDAAFPSPTDAANRRASMHVAIHEAGHAVEKRTRDDAVKVLNSAATKTGETSRALKDAVREDASARTAYSARPKPTVKGDDAKTLGKFTSATAAVYAAQRALVGAKTAAAKDKAEQALDAAVAKRDAALAGMGAAHPMADRAAAVAQAQDGVVSATKDHAAAMVDYRSKKAAVGALEAKPDKTKILADFQKATKGEKAVSGYGGTAPDENFAEAYALYRRDPGHLANNFPKAHAWFARNYP
ncbi:MAG: hypothetical protein IT383_20290 [Deltaproteobacteria bacterium]|nr:hypothetical protein [Deltaproteobacteria bacterium]